MLAILLNKLRKGEWEAGKCCEEALRRDVLSYGEKSIEALESKAELAKALYYNGET